MCFFNRYIVKTHDYVILKIYIIAKKINAFFVYKICTLFHFLKFLHKLCSLSSYHFKTISKTKMIFNTTQIKKCRMYTFLIKFILAKSIHKIDI